MNRLKLKRSNPGRETARAIIVRADAERDSGSFAAAAALYETALQFWPRAGLHMQAGHMRKEARHFQQAEAHYKRVLDLTPDDPEIHLQLGHFYKTRGSYDDAARSYSRALELQPEWAAAREELDHLRAEISKEAIERGVASSLEAAARKRLDELYDAPPVFINADLYPKPLNQIFTDQDESFIVTRLGNHQRTRWGAGRTLRGIESIRGVVRSRTPVLHVDLFIDGKLVKRDRVVPGKDRHDASDLPNNKYSFNIWIDLTDHARGWHEVVLRVENVSGRSSEGLDWAREKVIIADLPPVGVFPESDGWIPPLAGEGTLEERINALPSVAHRASTRSLPVEPRTVLVQRLDQLGDMCTSAPSLLRLRELLPDSKIVGLLAPANDGLGRSLGVFDEVLTFDFPDDPVRETRVLERDRQLELGRMLAPYNFDIAIDLSYYGTTRQLLPLSGAPVMVGFGMEEWLTLGVGLQFNEIRSRAEPMRHAGMVRILVEAFASWLDSGAKVIRRDDLDVSVLEPYGIDVADRFVVLHAGSRIRFTRWPYFADLAEKLLHETDFKIVLMAEDDAVEMELRRRGIDSGRLIFINGKLPFDHFDGFVSYCSAFVGNDSGPRHLAGLRGVNVISIHGARTNWSEWGQSPAGVNMTRKVPCAGCKLHYTPEECAKEVVCVTGITVDEVFREIVNPSGAISPEARAPHIPRPGAHDSVLA